MEPTELPALVGDIAVGVPLRNKKPVVDFSLLQSPQLIYQFVNDRPFKFLTEHHMSCSGT